MDKRKVEKYLPKSIEALGCDSCKIVRKEKKEGIESVSINKTFRGYISSFGAAVTMGNFKAAVAFFCNQSAAEQPRQELIRLLWFLTNDEWLDAKVICQKIILMENKQELLQLKDEFLNASIAVKLAMNAYKFV